ncbi:MAG TPA: hypothetical protein VFZ18_05540, partial [Longimicrobiaceae bacterium]
TLALLLAAGGPLAAQADSTTGFVRIYLDCPDTNCDLDYFRREVAFVDYVRDPADAEVHILLTEQDTGGGGEAFTATFIDRRPGGRRDTLQYFAPEDATDDAERKGIARMLRLGLVPFVARTPAAARLEVFYDAGVDRPAAAPPGDRWNNWVFRVRGSGYVEAESRFDGIDLFGGVSARRTTAALKLGIALEGGYERDRFEVDSVTTVTSTQESYGASAFAVRSLGGHWGFRVAGAADRSSYRNRRLGLRGLVGLEYDVFPYRESASRLLTLRYEVGVNRYRYDEATIFQKTSETLFAHAAEVSLDATQPWGSAGIGARAYQYLDDLGSNSLRIFGDLEIRLLRGLSLELDGSVSRIRDQRYLPAEGLSPEEILLRQQELATDYRVFFAVGLSYSFGAIFNNVVNPRFGDGDAFF